MQKTILIVEDYEDSREFMKFLVKSFGYNVIEAENGLTAIDKFKLFHPDLILMDMSMPVMDGLTATKIIRSLSDGKQIPIIAVTAFGKNYIQVAIEAGCNDLLDKPVDFDTFEPILNQYLNLSNNSLENA